MGRVSDLSRRWWGKIDDDAPYADDVNVFLVTWPHGEDDEDVGYCHACEEYEAVMAPDTGRTANGDTYVSWTNEESSAVQAAYPKRFAAIMRHHDLVMSAKSRALREARDDGYSPEGPQEDAL